MSKRLIGLFTGVLCSSMLLTGCGSGNSSASTESKGSTSDKDNRVVIYTAAEEELILNGQELTDKETYLKEYMNDNEYIKVYNNDEYVIYDIIEKTEWRLK